MPEDTIVDELLYFKNLKGHLCIINHVNFDEENFVKNRQIRHPIRNLRYTVLVSVKRRKSHHRNYNKNITL